MTVRKTIFWLHLAAGLTAGLIVAVMSITGIAIAFEAEISRWIDRDLRVVTVPAGTQRLTLDELDARVKAQHPDFKPSTRVVPREPELAYEYRAGRDGALYVNPYTGDAATPLSKPTRAVLRVFQNWHRWLGMEGEGREVGKLVTGVANLAFLFILVSGLYMWWPRSWTRGAWRPAMAFVGRLKGRARDFNWHNVFGGWSAIVLIVIVAGGVMISFQWANRLIFTLAGEEPPARGAPQGPPPVTVPAPTPGQALLSRDIVLERIASYFPEWQSISFESAQGMNSDRNDAAIAPLSVTVANAASFQQRGRVQLAVDPYRGDVLSKLAFEDRSPGAQARIWLRFLHTGEAFGLTGKIIAVLASIGSLFLVYTGFALSYRRFFARKPTSNAEVVATA
jgi:uncharacterized iron-regulated membrane protein